MTPRVIDLDLPHRQGPACADRGAAAHRQDGDAADPSPPPSAANHPEAFLIVLLIDERPEEVTDMARTVKGEVVASTFDEPATRHVQVTEMVLEKAKRLVEHKRDVVILLDSITRLARAYNTVVPSSGKVLTGGVDANRAATAEALLRRGPQHRGRRFADHHRHRPDRHRQPHGRGDLRGVSRAPATARSSWTASCPTSAPSRPWTSPSPAPRKEELLVERGMLSKMWVLRRILNPMGTTDAMDFLLDKLKYSKTNQDFFDAMNT